MAQFAARRELGELSFAQLDKEMKINPPKSSIFWNSHYHYNGPFLAMARNSCNKKLRNIAFLRKRVEV
jgi:hypothetical protein